MMSYIWIAIGSAIGGAARYWCTGFAARLFGETFPWGTLLVNITGSLIIGFFATLTGPDGRFFVSSTTRQFVRIPNVRLEYVQNEPKGIQTAFWRSVGPSQNIFVVESFIDELAAAAKKDPVEYRRALLDKSPRAKAVLDLAAEKSGWGQPLPKGSGRGVSVQNVFGSYMAQVAEVAVSKDGDVAVKRITCAVDCGIGINPNTIEAQAQSAILYGLTAALYGEITLKDGRVEQSNFDSYRALRINEIPAIDIHIIDSGEAPGGMGEPETCAVPPAVTNAIFAATGVRLRKLPIDTSKLKA
jgi:isoquinoline 1-oxidoreductase subunit beta